MAKKVQCFSCGINILECDVQALNKKLLGRKIEKFFCINCLAEYMGTSTEELLDKIQDFKDQGCTLFK